MLTRLSVLAVFSGILFPIAFAQDKTSPRLVMRLKNAPETWGRFKIVQQGNHLAP